MALKLEVLLLLLLLPYISFPQEDKRIVYDTGISPKDITTIIDKHNEYRLKIAKGEVPKQPKGINLKRLKWDQKLADEAQKIANIGEFKHVPVTDERWKIGVGQNLFITKSTANQTGADWPTAIQAWFNEVKQYKYGTTFNPKTGHYTQLAWADTEFVGCGYSHYKGKDPKFIFEKLYVCNYGPGGNVKGQAPYKTGSGGNNSLIG